jgi:maleate isomerase
VPDGVTVHTGRMLIGSAVTPEALAEMDALGIEAARVLATCRPDVVIYACTASTIVAGREYDVELMHELSQATGVPCITATESILQAMKALRVRSVAVASPYTDELGAREVAFLEANGLTVKGHAHLGIGSGFELALPSREAIRTLVLRAWEAAGSADAVFIGCMNLGSHLVIDEIEHALGIPVITSTQASLWHAMRIVGDIRFVNGAGRLFSS